MRYSDYDLMVLEVFDDHLHESYRVPGYIDLTRMRHEWLRYLILRIAVVSKETGTAVNAGNAGRLLPELARRVFDDPIIWRGIVAPQIALCLDEAGRLHRALTDGGAEPDRIEPGIGDPHRYGRTTTKVSRNGSFQYYKPGRVSRRATLTALFGEADISESIHVPPDTPILDGYLQDAVPAPSSPAPDEEFWYHAGIFAAAADCAGIIDLHYGNIAPTDDAVAIIDDETVLALSPFDRERNLLTTLLLQDPTPSETEVSAGFMAISTPGISRYFPSLRESGPDRQLTVRMTTRLDSKPTPIGRHFRNLREYVDEFVAGLAHGYANIRRNRHAAVHALRSCPRESRSRALMYSTPGYARLSALVAVSPSAASSSEIHDRLVEELGRYPRATVGREIIASEARQLLSGDIPLFSIDPHSTHIVDGAGRVGRVRRAPIDECCRRILALDQNYATEQARIAAQCCSADYLASPDNRGAAIATEVPA
ncbi:DUF4135 domain-containing protein [Nocardia cyriacigeorgica]|uniref:DUF4135 domain-containing protein n=1 Tax=Nocardia cyriacigeorgica TaxID=135487 RepID=A0ABX0CRF3_9NOCA|nr:DUF4135 domain-containing protein [Nocardia cyriacigeorgica]NEW38761.1 DUF4135 domain-containing protein [Nocardia cyriacigeorgica]NEW56850.1 DUF4135 domain-containing protein [Nocardia cyriacigeorgica]